jgi:hypothetical protein
MQARSTVCQAAGHNLVNILLIIFLYVMTGSEGNYQALARWSDTAGGQQTVRVGH